MILKRETVGLFDQENDKQQFVTECDRRLEDRMETAVKKLTSTSDLRLFGLTGPTCSGKTTAARKLTDYLEDHGMTVHIISIDDFFYDKEYLHRRAHQSSDIEIDYDSEETIDMELLEEKTESLLSFRKTLLPHFDFQSGLRKEGECILPSEKDVFLFEGIQVLYPKVEAILNRYHARNLAIFPSSQLMIDGVMFEPNEIRLYRRLVRDFRYRSASAEFTFYLWKSVRENEEKNIFPNIHRCCAEIDSTMAYEIGMLKPYLQPLLQQIAPQNLYFESAQQILDKIERIQPISDQYLTEKSLYKEFI